MHQLTDYLAGCCVHPERYLFQYFHIRPRNDNTEPLGVRYFRFADNGCVFWFNSHRRPRHPNHHVLGNAH